MVCVVLTSSMLLLCCSCLLELLLLLLLSMGECEIASLSLCGAHKTSSAATTARLLHSGVVALLPPPEPETMLQRSAAWCGVHSPLWRAFKRRPSVQAVSKCWLSSFCSDFCKDKGHERKNRNSNQMTDNLRMYSIDCITANHR